MGEIRQRAAAALFNVAVKAAHSESPQYSLASVCLRAVSSATPTTKKRGGCSDMFLMAEAGRRHSRCQLKKKSVNHPTFGWVPADWVPHLDRGELPAPLAKGQKNPHWLPVAEADRLRADWNPPWNSPRSTSRFRRT